MPHSRGASVKRTVAASLLLLGILLKSPPLHGGSLPLTGAVVRVSTEAELQAAVQNLSSETTILLSPGTYALSRTLSISGALTNVGIRGDGSSSDDVVLVGPGMTRASSDLVPYGIWTGGGIDGVTVANLTIRDIYRQAIVFSSATAHPHLYNVHVIDAGEGLVVSDGSNGHGVNNGIVEYSTFE